jgi:sensor histidine kinase YesM
MALIAVYGAVTLVSAALLHRLRFGRWFRLLLEDSSVQRRMALFFFGLEAAMEAFSLLQEGIHPEYLVPYYALVLVMAGLAVGLVIYLSQRLDASRKMEVQRDVIAQQQLYERDLDAIRQEVRSFRHDYKNLLAGLSEQADEGELDQLRAALSELDTGFDRRIGEKIQASTQIGNVCVPHVRSLLLSKLAAMSEKGIDCRLEALYPVERVGMDVWDFTRCLGILLDNAAEAALETETPWVEVVLLAQGNTLSLRLSNPYAGIVEPEKIWTEGFSTKGEGRGLGLPGYQRILTGYANVASSTSWAGGVFVQELTVEGRI